MGALYKQECSEKHMLPAKAGWHIKDRHRQRDGCTDWPIDRQTMSAYAGNTNVVTQIMQIMLWKYTKPKF